eukprot:Hpha_TRINITY_DN15946_c1_g2::TRINITY_DN15946_c1_g2_i1::g.73101::m.73101
MVSLFRSKGSDEDALFGELKALVPFTELKTCPEARLDALVGETTEKLREKLHLIARRIRQTKAANLRPDHSEAKVDWESLGSGKKKPESAPVEKPPDSSEYVSKERDPMWLGYPLFKGFGPPIEDYESAVEKAISSLEGFSVCLECDCAIQEDKYPRHKAFHERKELGEPKYVPMTAKWYLEAARKVSADKPAIAMYSMEGPICYTVNTSMRNWKFSGDSSLYKDTRHYAAKLRDELLSYPPQMGELGQHARLFRAVGYEAHKTYKEGSVEVMPQPTSTTTEVTAMKAFFTGKDVGCVLLYNCSSARAIREYSRYPNEDEILILPETPFKVVKPDASVVAFIRNTLKLDFEVGVVILNEISDVEVLRMRNKAFAKLQKGDPVRGELLRLAGELTAAVEGKRVGDCRRLLAEGALASVDKEEGTTPLHRACDMNHAPLATLLLEHGADIEAMAKPRRTTGPLGNPLSQAAKAGCDPMVRLLLDAGADVNASDGNQYTAIHHAAGMGHVGVVALLLDRGADPNSLTSYHVTPLHRAALPSRAEGTSEVGRLLLDAGADPNVLTLTGKTPLDFQSMEMLSKSEGRALKALLEERGGIKAEKSACCVIA